MIVNCNLLVVNMKDFIVCAVLGEYDLIPIAVTIVSHVLISFVRFPYPCVSISFLLPFLLSPDCS